MSTDRFKALVGKVSSGETLTAPEAAAGLKRVAQDRMMWLDKMVEGRKYLCGDRFTYADIHLFAFLDFGKQVGQPLNPEAKTINAIYDRIRAGAKVDSFEHVHGLVEATKQAFLVRNRYVCDPVVMKADPWSFLADAALDERARAIDPAKARPWPEPPIKGDTVWMGAADSEGRMVSYIQSVYWEFGSGVVLGSTGVGWQNRGSSFLLDPSSHLALEPGRKPFHTLNPAMARLADGRTMVYGNMGGDGQPQSQAAVFSRFAMFGDDLQQRHLRDAGLLRQLEGALDRNEFALRFQPVIDLKTGKIVAAEALLRWSHPSQGLLEPNQFLEVADNAGYLVTVGEWVVKEACAQVLYDLLNRFGLR